MMTRACSWADVLSPAMPYYPCSNWFLGQKRTGSGTWTNEENKRFEDVLATYDRDTPDRWEKVAALIPGKTAREVEDHYRDLEEDVSEIEAGRFPCPGYGPSSFTLCWDNDYRNEGLKQSSCIGGKRSGGRGSDQERKKGIPWTEEEHK